MEEINDSLSPVTQEPVPAVTEAVKTADPGAATPTGAEPEAPKKKKKKKKKLPPKVIVVEN